MGALFERIGTLVLRLRMDRKVCQSPELARSCSFQRVIRVREQIDEPLRPVSYTHLTLPTIYSV